MTPQGANGARAQWSWQSHRWLDAPAECLCTSYFAGRDLHLDRRCHPAVGGGPHVQACSQYFGFFEGGKSIACILFLAFRLSYFQPTLKNLHTTTSKRSELILWMQSVSFVSSEIRMSTCLRLQQEDESTPCVVAALSSTISSKGDDLNDVLTTEVKSLSCFMYSTFYFRSLLTYCRRFFFFATDFCWSVLRPLAVTETMACAAATASSTECTFLSR